MGAELPHIGRRLQLACHGAYNQLTGQLIIPVAESCQEMNAQKVDLTEGGAATR